MQSQVQARIYAQTLPKRDHSPILAIDSRTLRYRAQLFLGSFPGETSYAVKANDHPDIIRTLWQSGVKAFDVASPHEMEIVQTAAPQARLHYHNPVRSDAENTLALHTYGCKRFAIDHPDELMKLARTLPNPRGIEIAVRFRDSRPSNAVQNFKSKFGANEIVAARLLQKAQSMGFAVGMTFHPGSQTLCPQAYANHIETAATIAQNSGVRPAFINVGGGFPVDYLGMEVPPLSAFFSAISAANQRAFGDDAPALECEPGRAMVGPAGSLQVLVKSVRRTERELFLTDGIYGGLMEVHQFPDLQPQYDLANATGAAGGAAGRALEPCEWVAFGPTCDPVDVLPFKLRLPKDMREGDIVRFDNVGAYSTATATRFNGYGGIEVRVV